ncbi:MAG: glyceraldehyde 3-phosphate dehydrogenase NAD-binding domain-containing protein, partial [Marinomonas sp.]
MTIKVGINGFGRMGRLSFRAAFDWDDVEFVQINDLAGNAATLAHLVNFDSVHGRWHHNATSEGNSILINGKEIKCTSNRDIAATDWSECDVVIEATGVMKT